MKAVIPWLLVVGLAVALAVVYMNGQKQSAELAQARADSQELQTLRTAAEDKKNQSEGSSAELEKLREDNKDLLRLRAEVAKLRGEKEQLNKQMQTAQQQTAQAQAQAQAAQNQAQNLQQQAAAAQAQAQAAALRANTASDPRTAACISNMRVIDMAKQQWAQQNGKTPDSVPSAADLVNYLPSRALPGCPGGGTYTLNAVNAKTTCNVAGHVQP